MDSDYLEVSLPTLLIDVWVAVALLDRNRDLTVAARQRRVGRRHARDHADGKRSEKRESTDSRDHRAEHLLRDTDR
jgi:hypothetical protein